MPSPAERLNFNQPNNELTTIANSVRKKLKVKNDYKTDNEYSSVNPNAISDGDEYGKGTGVFLDTINGGSVTDITERKNVIKINEYQANKPYTTPSE
jgi:hypothetical protein